DTGLCLEEQPLSRIWDRFYQVDTTAKRRSGGAGLGLAIVRSLVELHGGLVWAQSRGANRGSSFSFSLPLAPVENAEFGIRNAELDQSEAIPQSTIGVLSGPPQSESTVLVAEDDADQREILCEMLKMEGYHVVLAHDGEE